MTSTGILFPHQLFEQNVIASTCSRIYLVEEALYFTQYPFHKQKIAFHRASMKWYAEVLTDKGIDVVYVDAVSEWADIRRLIPHLKKEGVISFHYIDTTDYWLEQRIHKTSAIVGVTPVKAPTPLFLNTPEENSAYFSDGRKMFQTDYYKHQRRKHHLLLQNETDPLGGKWSFDDENRLKYPKKKSPPQVDFSELTTFHTEAFAYTEQYFGSNYGTIGKHFVLPVTHGASKAWLEAFFKTRFADFGAYEDAIVAEEHVLHHGLLTPMLNVGLLSSPYIVEQALLFGSNHEVPLNSVEGFIRQIVGWREFMRAVYELKGREERTRNYWGFTRKIPPSFWDGTTGIQPVDITIRKVLKTGYCHHIERLMVLGNFMLLCEFDPDEVYKWFMELFVDAYDWVMVPNIYGMSQFADGGLMSTKPYISGSNYLMKMSNYNKGPWQGVWDGMFWRFMHEHRSFFLKNPRLGMLIGSFDKMPDEKREGHLNVAEAFLDTLG